MAAILSTQYPYVEGQFDNDFKILNSPKKRKKEEAMFISNRLPNLPYIFRIYVLHKLYIIV